MSSETKTCQNCKQSFTIETEDFEFYAKIKVPAPTWCPRCRFQRRLSFQNLMNLYKRKCDLCGNEFEASYSPDGPETVYCEQCYLKEVA